MTYAEKCGKQPFNWLAWLDDAMAKEPSQREEFEKRAMAATWPTCACGNQDEGIERNRDGAPLDDALRWNGRRFYHHIINRDWLSARDTFLRIEARAAEILAEKTTQP